MKHRLLGFFLCGLMTSGVAMAAPLDSTFTYQGELQETGVNANGDYDFEFELFDAVSGGSSLAPPDSQTLGVTDGIFTAQLDFGDIPFSGDAVWIEIRVRPTGVGSFITLDPRQPITSAPYALHAQFVGMNAVGSDEIADGSIMSGDLAPGSVGSGQIDGTQVQRRISDTCPAGSSMRVIDESGNVTCETDDGPDDDWLPLGDGRLQNITGVRIQPDPVAMFPFTIRHQSTINSPTAALVESEQDFARLNFYSDPNPSFWTIAALSMPSPDDDVLNIYNSSSGDILSVRGNRRVGIRNTNPLATLHVSGGGVRIDELAHAGHDPRPVVVNSDGDLLTDPGVGSDKYLTIGPHAFKNYDSTMDIITFAALTFPTGSAGILFAPVELEDGHRIKEIFVHYKDNSLANDLTINLLAGGLGGNGQAVLGQVVTSGAVNGYSVDSVIIVSDHLVNNQGTYLEINVTSNPAWTGNQDTSIQAVVIRYQ